MLKTASDIIVEYLEEIGVSDIFAVSGGGCIFLCDAVARAKKLRYVCCHHEQGVGMATEAYARVKNDIGVSLVTSGPGATNCITGVAGSWMDSVPHLVLSGQAFYNQTIKNTGLRQLGIQEINIIDMVRPICKYAELVTNAQDILYHVQKAIFIAKTGRPGPVWLDIPGDVQNAKLDPASVRRFNRENEPHLLPQVDANLSEKVANIVDWLLTAKRPLIHVGQGVKISNSTHEFFQLIEKYNLPFVTARNANDINDWDHPLYVGRPGTFAQRGANFAVQNCDLYIAIGTRLCLSQTGYRSRDYARNAKTVMVDIDPKELNKDTLRIDLKICADAKDVLQELLAQLKTSKYRFECDDWTDQCADWKKRYPTCLPEYGNTNACVNSYYFIDKLSDELKANDVVVSDMGFAFQNLHQAFRTKKGQKVFTNCGLAAMGWGLPAAIGACIANDKKRTVCVTGDGGLMMNLQELATIMHNKLPIKIFLFNNDGYLTILQTQDLGFEGRHMGADSGSGLSFPKFQQIAHAHGFPYFRIENSETIVSETRAALAVAGPVFCELIMDRQQLQGPKAVNRRHADGSMNPTPFEDLYPFLDPKEFRENMLPGSKLFGQV